VSLSVETVTVCAGAWDPGNRGFDGHEQVDAFRLPPSDPVGGLELDDIDPASFASKRRCWISPVLTSSSTVSSIACVSCFAEP
jgi:hypothetical protein